MLTDIKNSIEELEYGVLKHGPNILKHCVTLESDNLKKYIDRCLDERLNYPIPKTNHSTSIEWFIPEEYKNMDIAEYLSNICPKENHLRLAQELDLFKKHNMIEVLKVIKFIVDTLRKNNIVWGVGRGSSVASYTLYLIGIHKIDSIKYNLPIDEFFKGE